MFKSLIGKASPTQISSHNLYIRNDILITSLLDFILGIISKNERIIDREPRFRVRAGVGVTVRVVVAVGGR